MVATLLSLVLVLGHARAAPPPAPTLSVEEQARVQARELVVRSATADVTAFMHVAAPTEVVLDAVLDLAARASEVSSLDAVEVYEDTGTRKAARYDSSPLGWTVSFHIVYTVDRANAYATYTLDPSRPNDISGSAGSYHCIPQGSGTLLVYRAAVDATGATGALRKAVLGRGLPEQLLGIRARAEARAR